MAFRASPNIHTHALCSKKTTTCITSWSWWGNDPIIKIVGRAVNGYVTVMSQRRFSQEVKSWHLFFWCTFFQWLSSSVNWTQTAIKKWSDCWEGEVRSADTDTLMNPTSVPPVGGTERWIACICFNLTKTPSGLESFPPTAWRIWWAWVYWRPWGRKQRNQLGMCLHKVTVI